jgi:hypothetical protein
MNKHTRIFHGIQHSPTQFKASYTNLKYIGLPMRKQRILGGRIQANQQEAILEREIA